MIIKKLLALATIYSIGCTDPSRDSNVTDTYVNDTNIEDTQHTDTGERIPSLEYSTRQIGPLSYNVTFSTDEETIGRVVYTDVQGNSYFIQDSQVPSKDHEVDVLGLALGETYNVEVQSVGSLEQILARSDFEVETGNTLPFSDRIPLEEFGDVRVVSEVYCPRPDLVDQDQLLLTNLFLKDQYLIPYGIMWDRTGRPIWVHMMSEDYIGAIGDHVISFSQNEGNYKNNNSGRVLLLGGGIPSGERAQEFRLNHDVVRLLNQQADGITQSYYSHHNYYKLQGGSSLPDGIILPENSYLTSVRICGFGCFDNIVIHDETYDPLNADPNQGVIWQTNMRYNVRDEEFGVFSNSSIYDAERGMIYYNAEDKEGLKTILYAFNMSSSEEIMTTSWVFGKGTSQYEWPPEVVVVDNFVGGVELDYPWFDHGHGFKVYHEDGDLPEEMRILVHNNGSNRDVIGSPWTKIMEYKVNTQSGDASILWAYPQEADFTGDNPALKYSNPMFGDVEKIGDRIFAFSGSVWDSASLDVPKRTVMMELEPNYETGRAELLWRMTLDYGGDDETFSPAFYAGKAVTGLRGIIEQEEIEGNYRRQFSFSNALDYSGYWAFEDQ